ncbi:aspartate 1-decarboxylase [Microbacterium sp. 18062]|uniref:aspartate 1-decarboxylase n=1 Tax=Microbacterium sp. 18062 TaxID=2681410 RepID=UPI00135BBFC3|nr:aspartate 1-decarboxylase [Microbacterium sp. 18062]
MFRTVLGSKIHRATVTQADLHYVGSVTIDEDLVRASGLVEGEKVQIVDIANGARIETYVISGPAGAGQICINGAAAHLVNPGDLVIIMSYLLADESELLTHEPRIVHVDAANRIVALGQDPAQPVPGATDQVSSRMVVDRGQLTWD